MSTIHPKEANARIGKQLRTLGEIREAAMLKQSLTVRSSYGGTVGYGRPSPAAFVLNRMGYDILRMLNAGLFIYKPKPAKNKGIKKGIKP